MPSYAVFGATGNVGQSVLSVLLQSKENDIHAYCRSKQKLQKLSPDVANNSQVQVFEGDLSDIDLLANCLRGTRAAFLATAETGNRPGCTIAQTTAHHVVSALEELKKKNERLPKLVVLSSASTDHRLMSATPKFLLSTLYCAFSNIYDDLKLAEQYIRSKDSFISATFIKPGALSEDTQKGHVLSLEKAVTPVSFLDLAAGMVEVADDESERYEMRGVAVNSTAEDVKFPWQAPVKLVKGLIVHFLPWMWRWIG